MFRWHILRDIRRHPLLSLLNVLSVALGVAVYLAVQIANQSANRAFAATVDLVAGRADLQITAPAGTLADDLLPVVASVDGVAAATPIVRGFVTLPERPGDFLHILGIDVFSDAQFRTFSVTGFGSGEFDLERWLREPVLAVTREWATTHNSAAGDRVSVRVRGEPHDLRIGFVLGQNGDLQPDPHFAAMDIGWAQEILGRRGELSEIQARIAEGANLGAVQAKIRTALPAGLTVAPPARRNDQVRNMLGGFQLNLTAMSLVSLLVGMFLIYNTVSAVVVRRRREIGILRSLGVTRGEIRNWFLGHAAVLGALGTALGIGGGILLASGLVRVVARTISSLYVVLSVRELALTPAMFISATSLGLASVILAAWLPASAAARLDPVRALHQGAVMSQPDRISPAWIVAALGSLLAAGLLSWISLTTGPAWLGFGAAFFVIAGFSFFAPAVTLRFSRSATALFRRTVRIGGTRMIEGHLAAANLGRSLVRNCVTIAALASAVAMTIGVSVMVFSFRQTVSSWLDQTLAADLFVAQAESEMSGAASYVPPRLASRLRDHPAVAAVDTYREVRLPFRDGDIALAVVRGVEPRRFPLLRGDRPQILQRFRTGGELLVSESFARRKQVSDDDMLELPTPAGPQQFKVAGTFYDYTRDEGVVFMSDETFRRFWNDERVQSLAVYLKNDADVAATTAEIRALLQEEGEFMILSNRALRARVFDIFDQTFAVTYVLRTIAVIVAVVGICLSLTTLIAERAREFAVLRAIGASIVQLRRLLVWESGMIGLLAAVLGLISGLCLSVVLTGVINRAFFGWTIQMAFPWSTLALTPVWIVAVAVFAGALPAWRVGGGIISEGLRAE